MIVCQDRDGLVFWPEHQVASLTPEFRGRWRVVFADGSVAHRPTEPPPGPWLPLGSSRVLPQLLRRVGEELEDPAGFRFPYQCLPHVPTPEPDPTLLPKIGCRRDQVYALTTAARGGCLWHTDGGGVRWPKVSVRKAVGHLSELILVQEGLYIHPERLRKVVVNHDNAFLQLDNAVTFPFSPNGTAFRESLKLPSLDHLEPLCHLLYDRLQLRDWPLDLTRAPAEFLRRNFPTSRMMIANMVWQQRRYLQLGIPQQVATSNRDLWYKIEPALFRAGFLQIQDARFDPPEFPDRAGPVAEEQTTADGLYLTMFEVIGNLYKAGLLTYAELGYVDKPGKRRIGTLRPEVILVTEKDSLGEFATRLADEFGTSLLLLDGQPQLIATEFFAADLRRAYAGPIRVIAYVDYDTEGWIIGHATEDQFHDLGLPISQPIHFLIRSDAFTAEEVALHSFACSHDTPGQKTKTRRWVAESGGLGGKPRGMHSNHVQPYERVRSRFERALQS